MKKKQTEIKLYKVLDSRFRRKGFKYLTCLVVWIKGDESNKKIIQFAGNLRDINKINDIILIETSNTDYKITKEQWENVLNNFSYKGFGVDADANYGDEINYCEEDKEFKELNMSKGKLLNFDNLFKALVNCVSQNKIKLIEIIDCQSQEVKLKYKTAYKNIKVFSGILAIRTTAQNIEVLNKEYNKINNSNIVFNSIDFLSAFVDRNYLRENIYDCQHSNTPLIEYVKIYSDDSNKSYFHFRKDLLCNESIYSNALKKQQDNQKEVSKNNFKDQYDYARKQFNIND